MLQNTPSLDTQLIRDTVKQMQETLSLPAQHQFLQDAQRYYTQAKTVFEDARKSAEKMQSKILRDALAVSLGLPRIIDSISYKQ